MFCATRGCTHRSERSQCALLLISEPPAGFDDPVVKQAHAPKAPLDGLSWKSSLAALTILLAGMLAGFPARAQGAQTAGEGWLPIPPEELALKDNPASPGASAILLYGEITTDDVKRQERHYHRIKILSEAGKKYADIEIPSFYNDVDIQDIRAHTVQPDGKVVDFHGEIFDKVVVKTKWLKVQAKTFTLPDVRVGSIIEYSYVIKWRGKMPDFLWNPQLYLVKEAMTIPTAHWVLSSDLFTRRARFTLRPIPKASLKWSWHNLPRGVEPRPQADGTIQVEVTDLPAFEEEEFMPPRQILESGVNLYYMIGNADAPLFWRDQSLLLAEGLEKFLSGSKTIDREVANLVSAGDSPETKLRKLYQRAQQVRNLSYEPVKTEQEEKRQGLKDNKNVTDILNRGYGRGNEINLLFVALARAAGFQAAPVMLADGRYNFFDQNLMERSQLDAMVVWVKAGSSEIYLDPATRYCPFELLPWFESNTAGLRVGENAGWLAAIPGRPSAESGIERTGSLELDNDGNLQGALHARFTGQEALDRRIENRDSDEAARRKALEDDVKTWLPADATVALKSVSNWEQPSDTLDADFTLKIPNFATSTGRRMLLPSGIFHSNENQPFQNSRRIHPVYLGYPFHEVDEITLRLPPGKKVTSLPNPPPQNAGFASYEASCQSQGGAIVLKRKEVVNNSYFDLAFYSALHTFFWLVKEADERQVVLEDAPPAQAAQHP